MAVIGSHEVIGRSLTHKFGDSPRAERKFVITLDDPNTSTQDIIGYVGIAHLDPHPEYPFLRMNNASVTEGTPTPYHAEITYSYEVSEQADADPNPLARSDTWSFSTGGASVPALFYFHGTGNGDIRPLLNTANDFFEGAMTEEAECKATISGNRATFPLSMNVAVTNCVNLDSYLGAPPFYWKCNGVSGQQATEVVNGVEIRYWQITVELAYRQTGWPLRLPNIGYNYIDQYANRKRRAWVEDPEPPHEKVACANPIALTEAGDIKATGSSPDILIRRVHAAVNFNPYFGTPPF
jgi:hypothetical protein